MIGLAYARLTKRTFSTQSIIKQTSKIEALLQHRKPGTWFITDIDNALAKTPGQIGSDQWSRWRISKAKKNQEPLEKALNDWTALQYTIDLKPVEKKTSLVLRRLQQEQFPLIAITSRGMRLADRTVRQLDNIGINFRENPIYNEEIFWPRDSAEKHIEHILFEQGILFTSGQCKGKALARLLEKAHAAPNEIVYFDDLRKHVEDVAKMCHLLNIPFIGYHYRHLDGWVNRFNPKIAEQHLEKFYRVSSGSYN